MAAHPLPQDGHVAALDGDRQRPGMLVQQGIAPADADLSPALHQPRSARARIMGSVVGVLVLILSNALIVYVLFGLPPLQEAPPLIRLVIAVLPNFYLIPFARRLAARWP
jgi:hypothetical protein